MSRCTTLQLAAEAACIADSSTAVSDEATALHERFHIIASVRFIVQALVKCGLWALRVYSCGDVCIDAKEQSSAAWHELQATIAASVKATVAFYERGNELDEHVRMRITNNISTAVQQALSTVTQAAQKRTKAVQESPVQFQDLLLKVCYIHIVLVLCSLLSVVVLCVYSV
jgi:hypothetical protein